MANSKLSFTNKRLSKLPVPSDRAAWHYDDDTPGFAITISPTGKRVFYYVGRVRGKPQRIKVGEFPTLSVSDARDAVRGIVGDVARGREVAERKRAGRASVDDLFDHYLAVWAKPKKRTWQRDESEYARLVKPVLGARLVTDIDRDDIEKLTSEITERDGRGPARKARALLSKMFEVGIRDKWCTYNPVRGTHRPEFDARQRYLKADEVAAFMAAVDKLESDLARDFFRLALYTGARRSNVASMRWDELDLSSGLWLIPASKAKGKKPQLVPLSSHAVAIIEQRRQKRRPGVPWVLPGRGKRGHYSDPKDAWKRVCELAGIEDLRIHDLRRSLGAWQQAGGASMRTIQETLGHSNPAVTAKFYSPVEVAQVRAASEAAIDAMRKAAEL